MLTKQQTIERNAMRNIALLDKSLTDFDSALELACLEHDSAMEAFNECRGIYGNVGEAE